MIKVFKMYKLLNNDNTKSKITAIFSKCEILDNNKSTIIIVFLIICCLNMTTCLYIFIGKNNFPNWILKLDLQILHKYLFSFAIFFHYDNNSWIW